MTEGECIGMLVVGTHSVWEHGCVDPGVSGRTENEINHQPAQFSLLLDPFWQMDGM